MKAILRNWGYDLAWILNECNLYMENHYVGIPVYAVYIISCSSVPETDCMFFFFLLYLSFTCLSNLNVYPSD